jgi:hypothetical protein
MISEFFVVIEKSNFHFLSNFLHTFSSLRFSIPNFLLMYRHGEKGKREMRRGRREMAKYENMRKHFIAPFMEKGKKSLE